MITFVAVFFATTIRSIGPCIPIVIILTLLAVFSATIFGALSYDTDFAMAARVVRVINPLYSLGFTETSEGKLFLSNEAFITEVANNIV